MKPFDPKAKRSFVILMSVVAAMILLVVVLFVLMSGKTKPSGSTSMVPDMASSQVVNKAEGESSPTSEYAAMAAEADKKAATVATAAGGAYVPDFAPPAESVQKPVAASTVTATLPQPSYNNPPATTTADSATQQKLSDRLKRIEALAGEVVKEGYSPVKAGDLWSNNKRADNQAQPVVTASGVPSSAAGGRMIIKSGEKVFVSIDTAINTDEPSPVIAAILSGAASGWKMFGQTRQNPNNTLSVEFTRLTLPSGSSIPVSAFAIDPQTGRTAVSGSVDHKIFERFVLPAMAAGLGKYGEIVAQQGTQTTASPLAGSTVTTKNMTRQQMRDAAIGASVGETSSMFGAEAKAAKPSVSTERNLGIEVVFMQEVVIPEGK